MEALIQTLSTGMSIVVQPLNLLIIVFGTLWGLVFGAIPGLTATMGVALALPLTFGMNAFSGLILLSSVYIGGISGGFISATLINIPGTPSSIATTFEAYPMSRKGKSAEALALGATSSFLGGLVTIFPMILFTYAIAQVALKFGPFEYFALGVLAFAGCMGMLEGGLIKNAIGIIFGLLLATIGTDILTGMPRLTFGISDLASGIDILPLLVGMFGISEVLLTIEKRTQNVVPPEARKAAMGFETVWWALKTILKQPLNFVRSLLIGFVVGVFPATGGATSSVMAYGLAKSSSKHPDEFGTGIPDGIIASETANNASITGALVPLLSLGIPGDSVTAMMIGGFMLHGLFPGPLLFRDHPEYVYTIFAAQLVGIVSMFLLCIILMKFFIQALSIKSYYLFPIIVACMTIGAYGVYNRIIDVWIMLVSGVIGYILRKLDFPLVSVITAFVLGPIVEKNLRQGLALSSGSLLPLFTRPISLALLIVAGILFALGIHINIKTAKRMSAAKS